MPERKEIAAQPQAVAGLYFPTKKCLTKHVKRILNSSPLNSPLTELNLELITMLLHRHPRSTEKIGSGIESISVTVSPPYYSKGFEILRTDGTVTKFSYKSCLTPSLDSHSIKVKSAFRIAVFKDAVDYKRRYFNGSKTAPCQLSNEPVCWGDCEVDHLEPWPFQRIYNDFIAFVNLDVERVKLKKQTGVILRIADIALRERWILFHRQRAEYQVVSKKAHRKITKERNRLTSRTKL